MGVLETVTQQFVFFFTLFLGVCDLLWARHQQHHHVRPGEEVLGQAVRGFGCKHTKSYLNSCFISGFGNEKKKSIFFHVLKNKCFSFAYICIDITMLTVMLLQGVDLSWLWSCFKLRFPFCHAWLLIALASMPSLGWYFPVRPICSSIPFAIMASLFSFSSQHMLCAVTFTQKSVKTTTAARLIQNHNYSLSGVFVLGSFL